MTKIQEIRAALEGARRALTNPTMTVGNNIVATIEVDRALAMLRSLGQSEGRA